MTEMRQVFLGCLAAPLVLLVSVPAFAETAIGTACRSYAAAVADDYMSDRLVRLGGSEEAGRGFIIAHVGGRKYLMPRAVPGEGPIVRESIGTTAREWADVYREERRRCLRHGHLGAFLANN